MVSILGSYCWQFHNSSISSMIFYYHRNLLIRISSDGFLRLRLKVKLIVIITIWWCQHSSNIRKILLPFPLLILIILILSIFKYFTFPSFQWNSGNFFKRNFHRTAKHSRTMRMRKVIKFDWGAFNMDSVLYIFRRLLRTAYYLVLALLRDIFFLNTCCSPHSIISFWFTAILISVVSGLNFLSLRMLGDIY